MCVKMIVYCSNLSGRSNFWLVILWQDREGIKKEKKKKKKKHKAMDIRVSIMEYLYQLRNEIN